jgi:hypothetical protein
MTEGHDEPCYYCGIPCNNLIGNPGMWSIPLCHSDEPGKVKWHHIGCVSMRLGKLELIEQVAKQDDLKQIKQIIDEVEVMFKPELEYYKNISGYKNGN